MRLKIPKLNTKQAITIALLIVGLLYTGAYIYGQHRLAIERRDSIKKWCMEWCMSPNQFGYGKKGIDNCIKYFGK